ncbi:hypothetical protein [Collinsella ihumii]|uniref:Uncharacterized protein n=1 Tax=Collinsella ihumii TaxID=1720204 RepID=A0AAW7JSB7_9ACTN|nr:hypothetical protein [Collinsella ihumii]MDN0069302.1 hypothetical protein [Collinsella ihumii]
MADQNSTPLTDEERAELEALRAEKTAREEAERARKERAELEALRAESKKAEQAESAPAPASAPAPQPKRQAPAPRPADHEPRTFGQRMVMTPEETDDDGIPKMPPAQKIIILIVMVCFIGGGIYIWLSNSGLI